MILNQYGHPVTSFVNAATQDPTKSPVIFTKNADIDQLIQSWDRRTISAMSNKLYANHFVIRTVANQRADYSIGDAFHPIYNGESDKADGDEVAKFMREEWYSRCEVRGGMSDLVDVFRLALLEMDRGGDAFILLTESRSKDWPMIQMIPSHRITSGVGMDNLVLKNGTTMRDGVIYRGLRPVAYRFYYGADYTDEFTDIPAKSIIHIRQNEWMEQGRGFPLFLHALEHIKHALQSTEHERIRQMLISMIGLIEHNEYGAPEEDIATTLKGGGNIAIQDGVTFKEYSGGTIRYMKANSGAKLEQIKHETPGTIWTDFQNRLAQEAVNGAGWAGAMIGLHTGQGTAERAEIIRVRRTIVKLQTLMKRVGRRVISYAYSYLAERGDLPLLAHPFAWDFTTPPRLTLDDGKEAQMNREGFKLGLVNLDEIIEGQSVEDFLRKRATYAALEEKIRIEVGNEHGVEIDPRKMSMLTPNEQPKKEEKNEP